MLDCDPPAGEEDPLKPLIKYMRDVHISDIFACGETPAVADANLKSSLQFGGPYGALGETGLCCDKDDDPEAGAARQAFTDWFKATFLPEYRAIGATLCSFAVIRHHP